MTQIPENIESITKLLSPNDLGLTGGHQAGILVPKKEDVLSFFPKVNPAQKNPRCLLTFYDDNDKPWVFSFIYYNNSFFGGTRNEYRLTRMTEFFRVNNLNVGDELFLTHIKNKKRKISFKRNLGKTGTTLNLSTKWKVIKF